MGITRFMHARASSWLNRFYETTIGINGIIVGLYAWQYFASEPPLDEVNAVPVAIAVVAGTLVICGLVLRIRKASAPTAGWMLYLLSLATVAALVLSTQSTYSPFIALWVIVSLFAGVFGFKGVIIPLLVVSGYLASLMFTESLVRADTLVILLAGELPLIVSGLFWRQVKNVAVETEKKNEDYKLMSSELHELASQSEFVINAIGDGVLAIDNQGIIQLINPAAAQLLGWRKQDALTLHYKSVFPLGKDANDSLADSEDPIMQVLNTTQEARTNELSIKTKNGKKLLVAIVVTPVGSAGSGVIVVFRDITSEKAEEREQAEFISTASHEMRTPVASIEGYLGLALNPATATIDEKARDFINKAHESAQHLGRLFQDLLDVTRAEDGRLSNKPKVVDIVAYAEGIIAGLRPKANEKGLELIYKPANGKDEGERQLSPLYYVNADNDHIREVINNLTENAIKYTPSGQVIIDISGENDKVTISIKDSGIGIPAEDIPHLFQKFYRVDNSDTREIGGTGLGLYLCRRLAETMNGTIWVESEYKKGSTFYFQLPRISTPEAHRLQEEAEQKMKNETQAQQPMTVAIPQQAQPVSQPVAVTPQPQPQPQPSIVTSAQPVNTPLSAIEGNPSAYTQSARSGSVAVPRRDR